MAKCYECAKEIKDGLFRCDDCLNHIELEKKLIRRRSLTKWEEKKLQFYRDNNLWQDDIRRRSLATINGKEVAVYKDKEGKITGLVPQQPRHLWSKASVRQSGFMSHGNLRVDK